MSKISGWKAAGRDGIYTYVFRWKRLPRAVHIIIIVVMGVMTGNCQLSGWLVMERTQSLAI